MIGVGAALAFARSLQALLYQTATHDALTFTAVPALLAVVALAAAYVPARRSTHVDPVTVLRSE